MELVRQVQEELVQSTVGRCCTELIAELYTCGHCIAPFHTTDLLKLNVLEEESQGEGSEEADG